MDEIGLMLSDASNRATSLDELGDEVIVILKRLKEERGALKIGYVSGMISSEGLKYKQINRKILGEYTKALREYSEFPLFSAIDVISEGLEATAPDGPQPEFYKFWRKVLQSGYVTDIYMTPRWQKSRGAKDEHDAAKESKLNIHYLDNDSKLMEIFASLSNSDIQR